jgi:hypothetical protein
MLVGEFTMVGCGNMAISLELKLEGHCSSETRKKRGPPVPQKEHQ